MVSKRHILECLIQPFAKLTNEPSFDSIFIRTNTCAASGVTRADESVSSCTAGECAFKWFLTHWTGIMPELSKSLRWAASAYAHDLGEHAASWLPFTKAGTQGQKEWE